MHRFSLTTKAQNDLEEIWNYIARDSIRAADQVLADIYDILMHIAESPGMGRHREELGAGLHSYPAGNYLLFYREIEVGIEIDRVLHGARDIESIFRSRSNGSSNGRE